MQINLIMKAIHYDHGIEPLISKEMEMKDYSEAEDIASKLNDISKAKGETRTEYWVVSTEIPSMSRKLDDDIPFYGGLMEDVPILDKEVDDWGSDEQEEAYDKLQSLKQDFEGVPSKLYINEDEELQSYLMWFARMENLPYEITDGETKVC